MEATSRHSITAFTGTLQNMDNLSRTLASTGCSLRHTRMWGWMPISRSLATDCWVGLVFNSPAAAR